MQKLSEFLPIANSLSDKTNKSNSQLVDHLLNDYSDLIEPGYAKWFAARFYRLPEEVVRRCGSEARADGKTPKKLFAFLIRKHTS